MKDTTTNMFYHPLTGKQPPAVEDLKIRCEGMRELKILEDACKLAAYRHYRETALIEAHDAYYLEPFYDCRTRKPKKRPFALGETDLLRALLSNEPQLINEIFLCKIQQIQGVTPDFERDVYYWQQIVKDLDSQVIPVNLDHRWGRRWGLALMREPGKMISMETWAGSVVDSVINTARRWDKAYAEGLIARNELELMVRYTLTKTLKWELRRIPAAFYNRENLLTEIEDGTKEGPGILIVGKRGSGLIALMMTFVYRLIYDSSYHRLRDYSVVYAGDFSQIPSIELLEGYLKGGGTSATSIPYFPNIPGVEFLEEEREYPCLYGLAHDLTEAEGGPAWSFCSPKYQSSERAGNTVRILRLLSEKAITSRDHFMILTVDSDELSTILETLPATKNFSQIYVPQIEDVDLLPILLAKFPQLVDNHTHHCSLNLIIRMIYQLAIAHPDKLSAWEIGRLLLNPPHPDAWDLGLLSPYVTSNLSHISLKHYYQGVKSSKKYEWFCDRFVGGQDNLTQLLNGEKLLKEMCS